ncbi:[Formate-C-acetyltransferase]-activating enzyme [Lentibacillus sp. JNUCC-1]|uniref:pyruvate formate-lyase-activating protein n=1 Tax=Lentibacillus sp. JNUCC-1 TaxID=2654513 RepID=UPI0012E93101|nr:pyruvate formate-lyase-activating protein [Lentibacillus sp. JNUCC-1]MUV38959.1 [Formate-C-acetyltransferase]-activating enzyme [Lentibacillus sp. JNUCC-1]
MEARIHSVETCGTLDGPGLRYIVFMQGCPLRCQFCHNPDTWKMGDGRRVDLDEIIKDIETYKPFFKASNGGVTISGGEPLLQIKSVIYLFRELKKRGIHTAIDTAGGCFSNSPSFREQLDELMELTDLVLMDIKQINAEKHKSLTGMTNSHILEFAKYLAEKHVPVWIRHVLVPGISDIDEDLMELSAFIQTLDNVEKVDVLPYHQLGVYKWKALGYDYPLEGIEPPATGRVKNAERILNAGVCERMNG